MGLEKFDVSYWRKNDKEWLDRRKLEWAQIEGVLSNNYKKAELNAIKQYFLKGKLPNWEKYKGWEGIFRPMDLRIFLWLHPNDDYSDLKSLYRDFISSNDVHRDDIVKGYECFIDCELLHATSPYKHLGSYPFAYMGYKNRVLFNVLFDDMSFLYERLSCLYSEGEMKKYVFPVFEGKGYLSFLMMENWLLPKFNTPMINYCLYQFPEVIDWCVKGLSLSSGKKFLASIEHQANVEDYQKALYCFYHYDVREEDDRARFQFLQKIRQVLDDGDFVPEFKEMWNGVKSGEIVCDGAF